MKIAGVPLRALSRRFALSYSRASKASEEKYKCFVSRSAICLQNFIRSILNALRCCFNCQATNEIVSSTEGIPFYFIVTLLATAASRPSNSDFPSGPGELNGTDEAVIENDQHVPNVGNGFVKRTS